MAIYTTSGTVTSWAGLSSAINTFTTTTMGNYSPVYTNGTWAGDNLDGSKSGHWSSTQGAEPQHALCIHHTKSKMNYTWSCNTQKETAFQTGTDLNDYHFTLLSTGAPDYVPYDAANLSSAAYDQKSSFMRGYMMQDPDPTLPHATGVGNNSPQASVPFGAHELVTSYDSSVSTALGGKLGAGPYYKECGIRQSIPNTEVTSVTDRSSAYSSWGQFPGCEQMHFADGINYNFYGGDGLGGSSDYFHMVLEIRAGIFSHWWSGQIDSAIDTSIIPGNGNRFGGFMGCSGPYSTNNHSQSVIPTVGSKIKAKNPMNGQSAKSSEGKEPPSFLFFPEGSSPDNWEGEKGPATPRTLDPVTGLELTAGACIDMDGQVDGRGGSINTYGGLSVKAANIPVYRYTVQPTQPTNNSGQALSNKAFNGGGASTGHGQMGGGPGWAYYGMSGGTWGATGAAGGSGFWTYGYDYLIGSNSTLSGRVGLGANLCVLQNGPANMADSTAEGLRSWGSRATLLGSFPGVNPVSVETLVRGETVTVGTTVYDSYPLPKKATHPDSNIFIGITSDTNIIGYDDRHGYFHGGTAFSNAGDYGSQLTNSGFKGYVYEKP